MTPEEIKEVEEFTRRVLEGKDDPEKPAEVVFPQMEEKF